MATPPIDPAAIHGTIPTTTDTPVPAPEVLLTRPYEKRSLAAMEPEFVDNNDINGMAPSSAILQSDFIIMDDAHNLEDKVDMSHKVAPTRAPIPPASKRVRYTTQENEPTSSDYAQIKPIIQPAHTSDPATRPPSNSHSGSHSTMSRRRSIADLISPPRRHPAVYMDEPESTAVYGEPVDSSCPTIPLDDNSMEEKPPTPALTSTYPGSSSVAAGTFDHSPSNETENTPMAIGSDSTKNSNISHATAAASTREPHSPTTSRSSSLFIHSPHSAGQRRNSATSGIGSSKKGNQRPVRIQVLDEAECEKIQEQARRASASELEEDEEQRESDEIDDGIQDPALLSTDIDNESDIALPKEDPIVHDWDEEDLEDEESGSGTPSTTGRSTPLPIDIEEKDQRRRSIQEDIRRATEAANLDSNSKPRRPSVRMSRDSATDNDRDDDDWDPMLDPEREVAAMSEDQEADLYNVHLRLENQREFQDAAGLDLGEYDAQGMDEDGRYGGIIEADDEGEDYWENR